jgi:hypothetical protein
MAPGRRNNIVIKRRRSLRSTKPLPRTRCGTAFASVAPSKAFLYNAFNSDAILVQNNTFGAAWQRPITIIQPRFVKLSARWDF